MREWPFVQIAGNMVNCTAGLCKSRGVNGCRDVKKKIKIKKKTFFFSFMWFFKFCMSLLKVNLANVCNININEQWTVFFY